MPPTLAFIFFVYNAIMVIANFLLYLDINVRRIGRGMPFLCLAAICGCATVLQALANTSVHPVSIVLVFLMPLLTMVLVLIVRRRSGADGRVAPILFMCGRILGPLDAERKRPKRRRGREP